MGFRSIGCDQALIMKACNSKYIARVEARHLLAHSSVPKPRRMIRIPTSESPYRDLSEKGVHRSARAHMGVVLDLHIFPRYLLTYISAPKPRIMIRIPPSDTMHRDLSEKECHRSSRTQKGIVFSIQTFSRKPDQQQMKEKTPKQGSNDKLRG